MRGGIWPEPIRWTSYHAPQLVESSESLSNSQSSRRLSASGKGGWTVFSHSQLVFSSSSLDDEGSCDFGEEGCKDGELGTEKNFLHVKRDFEASRNISASD
jgi:hypothetical protein